MVKPTPVEAVCRIPASFYGGNKSFTQLVRESGIAEAGGSTVDALASVLRAEPGLIDGWLRWSENKRVSSGWYFMLNGGACVVGYYPNGERLRFDDAALACAKFILREVGVVHAL